MWDLDSKVQSRGFLNCGVGNAGVESWSSKVQDFESVEYGVHDGDPKSECTSWPPQEGGIHEQWSSRLQS